MLLGIVEFFFRLEEAFSISIPDEDAESIRTVLNAVEYVSRRVPQSNSEVCLSQGIFYRVRNAAAKRLRLNARELRPETKWESILPRFLSWKAWWDIRRIVGLPFPNYPLWSSAPKVHRTIGQTANYLVARTRRSSIVQTSAWTRQDISIVVRVIVAEISKSWEFREDDYLINLLEN